MANAAQDQQGFSLAYIFQVTRKYSLYIMGVIGVSVLLAIILTLPFIYKPEFRSSAIMYPTSSERFDVTNVFAEEPDLYVYGAGKEVEKLENIASSEAVKLYVIDSLDLWDAYGVDPEQDAYPKFEVLRIFDGYVKATRVSGHGLEIEAYDVDPQRAADIVNLMLRRTDEMNRQMLNDNKATILAAMQQGATEIQRRMVLLSDSLSQIRSEYNVLRATPQTERMVEQIMLAQAELAEAEAGRGSISAAQRKLDHLTKADSGTPLNLERFRDGLDQTLNLENLLEEMATHLAHTREKIEYLRAMSEVDYHTTVVASYAQPSDRKARPVRWIILVATLLIATLVSIFGAVLVESITHMLESRRSVKSDH